MSLQRALAVLEGCLFEQRGCCSGGATRPDLIAENPNGTIANPDWFNIWTPAGAQSADGSPSLTMTRSGTSTRLWPRRRMGQLARHQPPIYNDDFTQMTVKLREGIYWSDGVEFSCRRRGLHGGNPRKTDGLVRRIYQLNVEASRHRTPMRSSST
jgi:ABC-type transport system substrate-binding protein